MRKINRNEVLRWIIAAFGLYHIIKILYDLILHYINSIDILPDLSKPVIISSCFSCILNLFYIAGIILILIYFLFSYGRNLNIKTLISGCFISAGSNILLLLNLPFMIFSLGGLDYGQNFYGYLQPIISVCYNICLVLIFITVGVGAIKNFKNEKSVKITCIILFIFYIVFRIWSAINLEMFYSASSIGIIGGADGPTAVYIASKIFNIQSVFLILSTVSNLAILFYVFFMDKNYCKNRIEE